MAIICDTCKENVTPNKNLFSSSDMRTYELVKLNGRKVCLCIDCYIALSEFVTSKDFLKVVEKYRKERE